MAIKQDQESLQKRITDLAIKYQILSRNTVILCEVAELSDAQKQQLEQPIKKIEIPVLPYKEAKVSTSAYKYDKTCMKYYKEEEAEEEMDFGGGLFDDGGCGGFSTGVITKVYVDEDTIKKEMEEKNK